VGGCTEPRWRGWQYFTGLSFIGSYDPQSVTSVHCRFFFLLISLPTFDGVILVFYRVLLTPVAGSKELLDEELLVFGFSRHFSYGFLLIIFSSVLDLDPRLLL